MLLTTLLHPVHISYTNMEYRQDDSQLVLFSRLFYSDLQHVLEMKYGISTDSLSDIEKKNYIHSYYSERLVLHIDGQVLPSDSLRIDSCRMGRESIPEEQTIRIYLSAHMPLNKDVIIKNQLLTDLFADQTNLMIISLGGEAQAARLNTKNNVVHLEKGRK